MEVLLATITSPGEYFWATCSVLIWYMSAHYWKGRTRTDQKNLKLCSARQATHIHIRCKKAPKICGGCARKDFIQRPSRRFVPHFFHPILKLRSATSAGIDGRQSSTRYWKVPPWIRHRCRPGALIPTTVAGHACQPCQWRDRRRQRLAPAHNTRPIIMTITIPQKCVRRLTTLGLQRVWLQCSNCFLARLSSRFSALHGLKNKWFQRKPQ